MTTAYQFLINALFIFGVFFSFQHGQIFGKPGDWISMKIPTISKPLFNCYLCMPSIWGSLGYWLYVGDQIDGWIIYVFSLTGFMYIIKLNFRL